MLLYFQLLLTHLWLIGLQLQETKGAASQRREDSESGGSTNCHILQGENLYLSPEHIEWPQNWSFLYVPRSLSSWITPPLFSPGGSRHSPGDQRHLLPSRCSAWAQGEAFQKLSIKKVQPILNWEIQIPVFFHITFSYHQGEWHALSRQSWGIHKWKRWTQNCQLRPFSK